MYAHQSYYIPAAKLHVKVQTQNARELLTLTPDELTSYQSQLRQLGVGCHYWK